MQRILGVTLLSYESPMAGGSNSKCDTSDLGKPSNFGAVLPASSQYKLKPILSVRRAKGHSFEAERERTPESVAGLGNQELEELVEDLVMNNQFDSSLEAEVASPDLVEQAFNVENEEVRESKDVVVIRASENTQLEA